jgi:radical SAM protein (TIGR01212 family)
MGYPWGDERRFNSYAGHFRKLMGGRVQKVAVNAGFTCPNRDGTVGMGGCTFCNNEAFTPSYCMLGLDVERQIRAGIEFHRNRYRRAEKFLVYFQSFSNTYAPLGQLEELYGRALSVPGVVGAVIGTRPDCVDDEKLDYFARLTKEHYIAIEYGVESCYDRTLAEINRGHDFAAAADAIKRTAERGIHTGAHFILGLPGESDEMLIGQTELINSLALTSVKFHQLQIFKGTAMEEDYARNPGKYTFRELPEYIDLFIEILRRLRPRLIVERFAGEAPPRWHAGPGWGLVRNEQLMAMLDRRLEELDAWQGQWLRPHR